MKRKGYLSAKSLELGCREEQSNFERMTTKTKLQEQFSDFTGPNEKL